MNSERKKYHERTARSASLSLINPLLGVQFDEVIAADNQPTKDFKSLRESSFQLFKEGHVQKLRSG